ncbi:DNA-3-methyladenine glycosylase [Paenibacillus shirakamiensis]|uniref:Putative 3-methyladenine DNA glycosylase n=1 Tax=Paenibacillus shirakamiensis TaxID=1265935 RepID=A0ABS4JM34_9BACL|nr:DNA-3-methyladenine glycosylase [Paenibacillus shirakamiensis]MBP2002760.1 DNA-3-methyladenine glycosylase [Paenibacillus shirakamiensis]
MDSHSNELPTSLFSLSALELAPRLLGHTLVRHTEAGTIRCRIVETESYGGIEDKGSHAFGGRHTSRTSIMYEPGGVAYIYLIYGMYHCLNVVAGAQDDPQAVLIRAVEPLDEIDRVIMSTYRDIPTGKKALLSNGPGKLCRALRIDRSLNGYDLRNTQGPLWLEIGDAEQNFIISAAPRINIAYAEEYADLPWRFYIEGNSFVSVKDKQPTAFGTFIDIASQY